MSLLEVRDLTKRFPVGRGRRREHATVVDNVSFDVHAGQTVALVGESGAGKSTTSYLILRLLEADSGSIVMAGTDVRALDQKSLRVFRKSMQIIFQDPHSSLDPRVQVGRSIAEPLKVMTGMNRADREQTALRMMHRVSLRPSLAERFPHELSGGQLQRVAIARALTVSPDLIVCDEAVSALDVSVRAQVLNLLMDIQAADGVSYLFVAHDLMVVESIAHQVIVLRQGRVIEAGPTSSVFSDPSDPYTRELLDAIPIADPRHRTWRPERTTG